MCLPLEFIQSHHTLLTLMAHAKALALKHVSERASSHPDTNRLCSVHVRDQQNESHVGCISQSLCTSASQLAASHAS